MTNKILIDRELLDSRIESLEDLVAISKTLPPKNWVDIIKNNTKKLRAALDAPQQESVAWRRWEQEHGGMFVYYETAAYDDCEPLYTNPAPSVPEGWQLVPKEPTPEMLDVTMFPQSAAQIYRAMLSAAPKPPTTDDRKDAERWRYIRRHLCLTGNGDGTCQMHALNLPCRIQGWPEIGESLQFHDAAIDAAIAAQKGEKE